MPDDPKPAADLAAIAAALAAKHGGDPTKALEKLIDENHDLRDKNRGLKAELTAAQGKAPKDGAVVLEGKDAEAWTAYQALGAPADLTKKLDEATKATERAATLEREQAVTKAASAAGYKPSVLTDLAAAKGFAVEVRTEKVDGADKAVPYAIPTGADGKPGQPVKLADYVSANLADYLPALTAAAGGGGGTQKPGMAGPKYPQTAGGSTAPQASVFQRIREQREAERTQAAATAKPIEERLGKLAGAA